jgi:UDP-glucose 4-epimerase
MGMLKYVVTGGAGFIGSALVRKLLDTGGNVTVIDNLLTGHERNLEEVRDRIDFRLVDIRDAAALAPAMRGADTVFHLAAIPSVPRSIDDPVPSHEVNINGTFNVLLAAKEAGVRRVIYAASSSAYGDSEILPKVETMAPRPKSPYAVQKMLGEYYASVFHSCYDLETVALRFFNVYGPRQDPSSTYSGVLSLFMKHVLARTPPTIFGDGEQSRDFTFVEDVAELCLKAANTPAAAGRMYNAGNGGRYTLNFIWELLQKLEGVTIPAKYGATRAGDVKHSLADTTAAVAELGHAPKFTLEHGIKRTLDWYRKSEGAPA